MSGMGDDIFDLVAFRERPDGSMTVEPWQPKMPPPVLRPGDTVWVELPGGQQVKHRIVSAGFGFINVVTQP